jgi:enhancing lycopene biosynthesis protein 2
LLEFTPLVRAESCIEDDEGVMQSSAGRAHQVGDFAQLGKGCSVDRAVA